MSEVNQFSLDGKVALVTGASHGIGMALAEGLYEAGATVAFCCSSESSLAKALNAYKEHDVEVKGYVCDVTDENQVVNMVKNIKETLGSVDILVNNAATIKRVPMHEMSAVDFKKVVDTDLTAQYICAKAVLPDMVEKRAGKIINICSMMSELGRETVSAYAAAKGGLKMLTKNIASEYGEYNIQCNGLGPGYIATEQTKAIREDENGNETDFHKFIISKTPSARWGTADDLKGPAIFLAANASDFLNGHILYVDGGILAYIGRQPAND